MAQVPVQGFTVSERAWFEDGRSGLITRAVFNANEGMWSYDLEGLGGLFFEADLFHSDPVGDFPSPVVEPEPVLVVPVPEATGDFVTRAELAELTASINGNFETAAALRGALRTDLDRTIAGVEERGEERRAILLADLDNRIVTQQSEIANSRLELDAAADESGEGGAPGLFRRISGFIAAPFTSLLDAVGEHILAEVLDGLNQRRS